MIFTLSWLKQFLDTDATLEQITNTLTMTGLELEDLVDKSKELEAFKVAKIIETEPHPDADKLKLCKVETDSKTLQIVCGAPNARAGIKVVLASIGTVIPSGNFKIKKSQIRGIESSGMMCSADELNIPGDSSGIIELPDDAVIGDAAAKYLGLDDPIIHINITPNRADALGVYGIARDLAASGLGTLKKLGNPEFNQEFETKTTLNVRGSEACPLFAIREIKDLENKESPTWLKNLLDNIGVGSISPVVDVTNYISYSFGQPMHAYDADKISDNIIVETLSSDEKFKALNEKEYELKTGDIVIRDEKNIHCLGGIIGGENSACDKNTKRIILEAASFDAEHIAKTGRRLIIDTDSRYRFERNVDREFTHMALDFATDLILSICNGVASKMVSSGDPALPVRTIDFPAGFLESRTNISLAPQEIEDILCKLGFICTNIGESIKITIPSWRYDVSIKEDIVEEIVRIYGYDKIPETPLPEAPIARIIPRDQRRVSDIKRLLASSGYDEIVTWSFMDSEKAKSFTTIKEELTLLNPISSDLDYMRPSILPNLLRVANNNINRSFHDLSLFEVGPIFEDTGHKVITHASGIRTGNIAPKNSHEACRVFDLFDVKADIAAILESAGLDINKCQIRQNAPDYYHPTRSASICLGKNVLGYFGQVHPLILKEFEIDADVIAFEMNISALPFGKEKYGKKPELVRSDYQAITRDYAFVVDKDQPVGEMLSFIKNADKKRVKSVNLFDIYSGTHIDADKKSVALSVDIQDDAKTLTESDIETINKAIIDGIEKKFSATLRG
ncbi:MAG: phenylalanine--tRNA ligase subunit beta [Rickettsiales bacterium]|nr:MAG: phenylalanine--tRNA ligase subunit beta [Rickettsiales bacterium]